MKFSPFILVFSLLSSFALFGCSLNLKHADTQKITLVQAQNGKYFTTIELNLVRLKTDKEKQRGLMGVKEIPLDRGVIMEYSTEDKRGIWMPNMRVKIDALFFDSSGKITALFRNLIPCKPQNPCPAFRAEKTQFIIETSPGFIDRHKITLNNTRLQLEERYLSDR